LGTNLWNKPVSLASGTLPGEVAHLAAPETLELLGLLPFLHSNVTIGKDVKTNKQLPVAEQISEKYSK
jgi:hypothetical protein